MSNYPNYPPNPPPVVVQNYSNVPNPPQNSTWAIISLIAGIFGFIGWGIGTIIAIIAGHIAKSEIRNSMGRLTGGGMATVGLILGYLQVVIMLIGCCIWILSMLGLFALPLCSVPFLSGISGFAP